MVKFVNYIPSKKNKFFEEKLIEYRKNRLPKTNGNPYYVLGEPIGDLRDNMGCINYDFTNEIMVEHKLINQIPVRIYRIHQDDDMPCSFYIHGGAFIGGSIYVVENPCKYLAQISKSVVINIDYRLAPECAYPENMNDCINVINSCLNEYIIPFHHDKVFISGDSAGANLALGCIQKLGAKLFKGAMLYYPVVDLSMNDKIWCFDETNYRGYPNEFVKSCATSLKGSEKLMSKLYVQNNADLKDSLVSPIYIKDSNLLCEMLIQYAEYDYLTCQIEAFCQKHKRKIESYCFKGVNHAFLDLFGIIDQAKISVEHMKEFIQRKI